MAALLSIILNMANEEALKKYPFLKIYDYQNKEISNACWLDNVPKGWRLLSELLVKHLNDEIEKSGLKEYCIVDIKEKYGSLRWYDIGGSEETFKLTLIYEQISKNVCVKCGRPNVGIIKHGWIVPLCKKCFSLFRPHENYENGVDCKNSEIKKTLCIRRYEGDKKIEEQIDCSPFIKEFLAKYSSL